MKTMKSIENEDFAARIEVKGQDEVARLATQFNQMASKINSLVDKVYKADIRKREAELRALQAQINPHFLYNTLDMIYWTAKMEQALETSDLINSLSHFFRSAFNPAGEYTTVSNEVEHLRYYIILLQQRKNHFDFNLEMDPDTSNCKTVKLILQPLVENSIIHGIENRENGQINILIQHRDDQLVYTVEDNGVGIDMADMEQLLANPLSSARGYGIRNVNDRISLAFGPEYGLRFLAKPEGGTIVTVVMPYLKEESE
jgi:two-component system sensor histidine kinase YesM